MIEIDELRTPVHRYQFDRLRSGPIRQRNRDHTAIAVEGQRDKWRARVAKPIMLDAAPWPRFSRRAGRSSAGEIFRLNLKQFSFPQAPEGCIASLVRALVQHHDRPS